MRGLDGMADEVRRRGRALPGGGLGVVLEPEHRGDPGPPYWLVSQDPSDPTNGGSLFEQTKAPIDTACGTCKTPIVKGAPCYAIYVSPENRGLLGYRCTKSICIDGELIDELPPGAKRVK